MIQKATITFDVAIMLLADDDKLECRNEEYVVTRDNVLIESGAFANALGIENVFLLIPHNKNYKLPSDFLGLNCIVFDYSRGADNFTAYNRMREKITQMMSLYYDNETDVADSLIKNDNPIRVKNRKGKIT